MNGLSNDVYNLALAPKVFENLVKTISNPSLMCKVFCPSAARIFYNCDAKIQDLIQNNFSSLFNLLKYVIHHQSSLLGYYPRQNTTKSNL